MTLVINSPQIVIPPSRKLRVSAGRFFQKPGVRVNACVVVVVVEVVVVVVLVVVLLVVVEVVVLVVEEVVVVVVLVVVLLVVVELVVVVVVVVVGQIGRSPVWKPPDTSTPLSQAASVPR